MTYINCSGVQQVYIDYALEAKRTAESHHAEAQAAVSNFRFHLPSIGFNKLYDESPEHVAGCSTLWASEFQEQMIAYNQTLDSLELALGQFEYATTEYNVQVRHSQVRIARVGC